MSRRKWQELYFSNRYYWINFRSAKQTSHRINATTIHTAPRGLCRPWSSSPELNCDAQVRWAGLVPSLRDLIPGCRFLLRSLELTASLSFPRPRAANQRAGSHPRIVVIGILLRIKPNRAASDQRGDKPLGAGGRLPGTRFDERQRAGTSGESSRSRRLIKWMKIPRSNSKQHYQEKWTGIWGT